MNRSAHTVLPPCLPGFSHIRRFAGTDNQPITARIQPGEFYVTREGELISTLLGSCISVCIRDPALGLGGMNHFLLPQLPDTGATSTTTGLRYGRFAMVRLVSEILRYGGQRQRLEAKLAGGGRIISGMSDIGRLNAAFARDWLASEGIPTLAEDTGGDRPRKVLYDPITGAMKVKKLHRPQDCSIARREQRYHLDLHRQPPEGDVKLFKDT